MRKLKTPDVTPLQISGLVAATTKLVVAFGVDLSKQQIGAIDDFVSAVLVVVGADAVVRLGRAIGTRGEVRSE